MIQAEGGIIVGVGIDDRQLHHLGMFAAFGRPGKMRAIETGWQVQRQRPGDSSAGRDHKGEILLRKGAFPVIGEPDTDREIHRRTGGIMGGHVDHGRSAGGKDIAIPP